MIAPWQVLVGDCRAVLATLPESSASCCVTSPPYWGLRDYGHAGQLGLEATPEAYVANMVEVFRGVRRVLADDGTLWLNLGDSYASDTKGSGGTGKGLHSDRAVQYDQSQHFAPRRVAHGVKPKDLVGIPWLVAFALRADGWYLRSDIIWAKPNPMPESVTDRPTKAHEYVFLLAKSERYFYDADSIAERQVAKAGIRRDNGATDGFVDLGMWSGRAGNRADGLRNARTVWTVTTDPFDEAHFATFPQALARRCILAGSPKGGTVLDPFNGAGTTGVVAVKHERRYVGIELNPEYVAMSTARLERECPRLLWAMQGGAT
jgi:DNA modification methylase